MMDVIQQWLPTILSGGFIIGAIGYFKAKAKHPIDVKAQEVRIEADEIKNASQIIEQHHKELKRSFDRIDKLEKNLDTERRQRSEQEGQCDEKIAALNRRLEINENKYKEMFEAIRAKCINGCFIDLDKSAQTLTKSKKSKPIS
jgi:chromosome segregation ATPase